MGHVVSDTGRPVYYESSLSRPVEPCVHDWQLSGQSSRVQASFLLRANDFRFVGAQIMEEITINIQNARNAVTNANNDAKNVNNRIGATRKYSVGY